MTISQENSNQDQNTPRTRNSLRDNTPSMESPEGYSKDDWTFRKQLEDDFRKLGFKSHKFSHKNEPEMRQADSLWLSWNGDSKKKVFDTAVTDIEVRVTFASYQSVTTITHTGRERGACIARRMGKATFVTGMSDSRDVIAHVQHLLTKPRIR